jgi:hypothetical protein
MVNGRTPSGMQIQHTLKEFDFKDFKRLGYAATLAANVKHSINATRSGAKIFFAERQKRHVLILVHSP